MAKLRWRIVKVEPLAPNMIYFLLLVKCGTHQAARSVLCALEGNAAKIAGGELYKSLAGTAVRLFKYILCDYFEEVCAAVHAWVHGALEVVAAGHADASAQRETAALRELYTEHVLPDAMLALFNNGLGKLSHVVASSDAAVAAAERPRWVGKFVQWMLDHLARVEHSPTPSRFFTFRAATDRMLTMDLIGFPAHALKTGGVNLREESRKRVQRALGFFHHADASQNLRRLSLCQQLTGGVEALLTADRKPDAPPLAVRLCRGEARGLVRERLQRLIGRMHLDAALEVGPAAGAALATAVDLLLRLLQFEDYPILLCRMSRRWFPETCDWACGRFLAADEAALDGGVGRGGRGTSSRRRGGFWARPSKSSWTTSSSACSSPRSRWSAVTRK